MPSGKRFNSETKRKALEQYYSGEMTVDQICCEMGIARRTIYAWIEKEGHGPRALNPQNGRGILRLSWEEAELILLMCAECEKILNKEKLAVMKPLENRVLDIADILYEVRRASK